ncbi:ribulokinase [Bythopirellula goksoeyrii]|uniref:Ribulokinase n=1 Tax=Bythopirellula goksoeyrii TaxID=1400387 RepID=A0A5B9QGH8_9BACT|nr:ribulokinase [Bythopirellula goksoeyrii]QEG36682.1 Ribulokinase [Bythopirellula goksoeyrii]
MTESSDKQFSIGVDYGTNSVRALVVDIGTGAEIATAVFDYPSGEAGILLDPKDPNLARQNPADYIEGFYQSVASAVSEAAKVDGFSADQVVGIGVDTTGSTPIPVNREGMALGTLPEFKDTLAAHAWLWKDHTSHAEAQEITRAASEQGLPYLAKCGGTYSSEWYWSKILHCMRNAPDVANATYSWVELADFVPAFVTGSTDPDSLARSICAAGHKAMYHTDWGGLPSAEFLDSIEPGLSRFRYTTPAVASDHQAGKLSAEVAEKVGLKAGIPVAVGAFDAHMGAVGAGCGKGTLVKIMGTSTCDCMPAPLADELPDVPGLCGIVPESIMPGMYGLEAGQSAVGDIFNWFVKQLTPAKYGSDAHIKLTEEADRLKPGESGLVALDWNNGNRTVLVDPLLTGLIVGQNLHTTAAEVYRALVEATAFGALTIINRMEEYGVHVEEVINCGGIAEKNPMVMQIYADVCNRPMKISRSAQTCALGAAIFGAVAAQAYPSVEAAQANMTGVKETIYQPIDENVAVYQELYKIYSNLHDAFGTEAYSGSLSHIMKDLIAIRHRVRKESPDA